jgi:hypothetical protein
MTNTTFSAVGELSAASHVVGEVGSGVGAFLAAVVLIFLCYLGYRKFQKAMAILDEEAKYNKSASRKENIQRLKEQGHTAKEIKYIDAAGRRGWVAGAELKGYIEKSNKSDHARSVRHAGYFANLDSNRERYKQGKKGV